MALNRKPLRYAHSSGHTDVCYSSNGKYILTCGKDGDIRVWLGLEDDDPTSICAGEWAQSLKCITENDESTGKIYVTTDALCVQTYQFPSGERDKIIAKFSAPVSHIAISKSNKILVAGGQDMIVKVINLEDNSLMQTFDILEGPTLAVAICPNDKYVAASSGDGLLRLWNLETEKLVRQINCVPFVNNFNDASVLCHISISKEYLAYPDCQEIKLMNLHSFSVSKTLTTENVFGLFSLVEFSSCETYLACGTTKGSIYVWNIETEQLLGCVQHPNKHDIRSLAWNPKETGQIVYCDITGQMGTIEVTNLKENAPVIEKQNNVNQSNIKRVIRPLMSDESDDDGDNVFSLEKIKNNTIGNLVDNDNLHVRPESRLSDQSKESLKINPGILMKRFQQRPFQCGSTPENLSERYLVWNSIGIVKLFSNEIETDDDFGSIEVVFHDSALHHTMHLKNYLNYSMASLSKTVLVLACDSPSKLNCISLTGGKEWQLEMPDGEEILCICASEETIAVATDVRYLRIFTCFGTQREVISIPGPIVTLAADKALILCAYHLGPGCFDDDQNISLMVVNIKSFQITCGEIRLALSPSSKLSWLGFTDKGTPCCFDSSGILRLFSTKSSIWLPVYDYQQNRKGVSDGFFVIEVSEANQIILGISCKGAMYPPISPQPVVGEYQLKIPLCDQNSEKSKLEEEIIRLQYLKHNEPKATKIKTGIKLFSLATRADLEQRAIELMKLLESSELINLAIRYASKDSRVHLAEKLNDLLEIIEKENNEDGDDILNELNENKMLAFQRRKNDILDDNRLIEDSSIKPLQMIRNKITNLKTIESRNEEKLLILPGNTPPSLLNTSGPKIRNPFSKKLKKNFNAQNGNLFSSLDKDFIIENNENLKIENSNINEEDTNESESLNLKRKAEVKLDNPIKQTKLSAFTFIKKDKPDPANEDN